MADNYLENKMEEHRRRSASATGSRRQTPRSISVGSIQAAIVAGRVAVALRGDDIRKTIVSLLCRAGCRVAFCSDDPKSGYQIAQAAGARYYPQFSTSDMIADIAVRWGGVDLLVVDAWYFEDKLPDSAAQTLYIGIDDCNIDPNAPIATIEIPGDIDADTVAKLGLTLCSELSPFAGYKLVQMKK